MIFCFISNYVNATLKGMSEISFRFSESRVRMYEGSSLAHTLIFLVAEYAGCNKW